MSFRALLVNNILNFLENLLCNLRGVTLSLNFHDVPWRN
jgi:hypothetical protein